jgi:hypothetical protein
MLAEASLKSLDFIVSQSEGGSWLVDVKGRHFPAGGKKQYWRNWSTRDDLQSLAAWQELFGGRSEAMFVFSYLVLGNRAPLPPHQLYWHRQRCYGFVGIRLRDYVRHARVISPKWQTLAMSSRRFRQLAEPFEHFLEDLPEATAEPAFSGLIAE